MDKQVILSIDGDFLQSFLITAEVWLQDKRVAIITGKLSPNPQLLALLNLWMRTYQGLEKNTYRLNPKNIVYDGYVNVKEKNELCKVSAEALANCFKKWLNCPDFLRLYAKLSAKLNQEDTIRLIIRSQNHHIQKLPWHWWDFFNDFPNSEHAFSPAEIEESKISKLGNLRNNSVKILAILGNSQGIEVEKDREFLQTLANIEIKFLCQPNHEEINHWLWGENWDIVLFSGHSRTENDTFNLYINETDCLKIDELWYALREAARRGLKLAIFNSCDGLGLARRLDDFLIPQIIVMRELVPDRVAQQFLRNFLEAFVGGKSLHLAVREAREKLQGMETQFPCASWLPVIWQNPGAAPLTWQDFLLYSQPEEAQINTPVSEPVTPLILPRKNSIRRLVALFLAGLILSPLTMIILSDFLNKKGVEYLDKNKLDKAQLPLILAVKINPRNSRALNNLGALYKALGELKLAREYFQKSKLLGDPWGCRNEGNLDNDEGNYGRAEYILRPCWEVMRQSKSSLGKYLVLSDLAWAVFKKPGDLKQWDYEEAEQKLRQAIEFKPKEGLANCKFADVLEAQNKEKEALGQWQQCLNARDDIPEEANWKKKAKQRLTEKGISQP